MELFLAKLLVVSGWFETEHVMNSEVIDLLDSDVTCQPWRDHPVGTLGAVGGLINNQLIICGGKPPNSGVGTSFCYAMTPSSTYNSFNLTVASVYSAGVTLDEHTLLVTGGYGKLEIFRSIHYYVILFI